LGLVALAVAGCQRPGDPTTAAAPTTTRAGQVAPSTTPTPPCHAADPAAYQVRSHNGEWEATLYLAQPVRHTNGVWVVTRVGDPVSQ
jgi:hypothetical protein